jgi:uncharacterized membrane protein YgcG
MITIKDDAHILNSNDISTLQSSKYNFNVVVFTTSGAPSKSAFEAKAASLAVNKTVVVAVDVGHHFTTVQTSPDIGFSVSGTGVSSEGNTYFKQGNWVGGINAILTRTGSYQNHAVVIQNTPIIQANDSNVGWYVFGGLGLFVSCIVGYVAYQWAKQRKHQQAIDELESETVALRAERYDAKIRRLEEDEFMSQLAPKIEEKPKRRAGAKSSTQSSTRYSAPRAPRTSTRTVAQPVITQPSTVVVDRGGNDLLTGVMLGSMLNDHHHHDTVVERDSHSNSSSWGDSSSSSSSSWDSGSSSSSSDWGSSSSSFDFGGGGSDSSSW